MTTRLDRLDSRPVNKKEANSSLMSGVGLAISGLAIVLSGLSLMLNAFRLGGGLGWPMAIVIGGALVCSVSGFVAGRLAESRPDVGASDRKSTRLNSSH